MAEGGDPIQNVQTIAPQHGTLEAPEALKALPAWLVWRLEQSPGEPKPRKVPYWTTGAKRHGGHGSPEDRSRLVTFAAARDFAVKRGFDGVGFAPLPEWGVTALDFDQCVGPNGEIPAEILDIVGRTYAEYSPSGTGIRAFVRGNLGNHKDKAREGSFGFETFSTNGFVTLTGNLLPICELTGADEIIADTPQSLVKLCEARFSSRDGKPKDPDDWMAGYEPRVGLAPEEIEEILRKLDPGTGREQWITVGMGLHHETEGDDTGLDLWDEWSCVADNYVSRDDLETQWASFDRRQGGPQITMRSVLKMVKQATAAALTEAAQEGAALAEPSPVLKTPDGYDGKFKVVTATELLARPAQEWFIKGVLPQAAVIGIYGASGSGKSFVLLDMLGAITQGREWRGKRTRKAKAVYVAAEGAGGVGKRLQAYTRHRHMTIEELESGLGVITDAPNLLDKGDVTEIVKAVKAAGLGTGDILTFDTMAQTTPGANENTSEDMGLALANAKAIHEATGATIIFIAHSGKDASRGIRGWSGIKGALDAEIEITRNEDNTREIHVDKMRDGEDGEKLGFRLEVVDLGIDADGDPVTSCVIAECDIAPRETAEEPKRGVQRLGAIERQIMDVADQRYKAVESVRYDEIVNAVVETMPAPEEGVRDSRRGRVVRALKNLSGKNGLLEITNGRVVFME